MSFLVIKKQFNRIITNKATKIVFLFLLLPLLITGCNTTKISNELIDQKSIETVLAKRNLSWVVEENKNFYENQNIYSLRNDDGIFCSMDVRIDDTDRDITLIFHYPIYISTDQIEQFNLNILPQTLELAGELYGNTGIVSKINKEMLLNMSNKIQEEENGLVIAKQYKNDCLSLTLLPDKGTKSIYKAQIFSIMNHSAYEKKNYSKAKYWINPLNSDVVEIESSSVSNIVEITESQYFEDNQDYYFLVKGHLENIRKPSSFSEPFKSSSNNFISYNKDGYLIADLVDETGSMEIYLSPTALNKNDLKQTRNHYIYYNNEINPFAVIRYSVLENQI